MTNIKTYNIARWMYLKKIPFLPRVFNRLTRLLYACEIPYTAKIEKNVTLAHKGLGVVIGHDTIIGENTKILQHVTIGGRNGIRANPVIGKNVLIGAGATILGNIKIGDNAQIGAGAVVLKDVVENSTVVGIPAKVI
jgi:serine O-acetyltransferase